jgi:hypothetical protein
MFRPTAQTPTSLRYVACPPGPETPGVRYPPHREEEEDEKPTPRFG